MNNATIDTPHSLGTEDSTLRASKDPNAFIQELGQEENDIVLLSLPIQLPLALTWG